jgi:hypothetical protein
MTRKEKIAAGLEKPPLSKYEAKRAARRADPDSPFAALQALHDDQGRRVAS